MLTYTVISLILVATSLFLLNFRRDSEWRKNNNDTFSFIISLISTFTGLFIALSVNTFLDNIDKKNNLIKLLNTTNLAIENCQMKTKGMYLNTSTSGLNLTETLKKTPVDLPKLYPQLATNNLVNDYFTSNAFQAYIVCIDNMETFVKNLGNTEQTNNGTKIEILNRYLKYLEFAKSINNLEIDRLGGNITEEQETSSLKKIVDQFTTSK
jgi:amino acid transporter